MKKKNNIIVLVLLAFALIFFPFDSHATGLVNFTYVTQISITNTSALINYPILINITDITNMNSTCKDVRFTYDDNTTLLNYFDYDYVASSWCSKYVNTSRSTIYMWYGNSTASSLSNGSNVFSAYAGCDGQVLDSGWSWVNTSVSFVNVSGGYCHIIVKGTGDDARMETVSTFSLPYQIRTRMNQTGVGGGFLYGLVGTSDITFSTTETGNSDIFGNNAIGFGQWDYNYGKVTVSGGTSDVHGIVSDSNIQTMGIWNIYANSSIVTTRRNDIGHVNTSTLQIPTSSLKAVISKQTTPSLPDSVYDVWVDYFFLGKYISPEPTYQFINPGGIIIRSFNEKTLSPLTFNITFDNTTETKTWNEQTTFTQNVNNITTGYTTITVSSEGYADRKYFLTLNQQTHETLNTYLLQDNEGQTVRFHIVTIADQPIQSVFSSAQRSLGGTLSIVEETTSDSSGTSTFFLDPTATYQLSFTHPSYTTSLLSILPSQQDYKITMTGTNNFLNRTFNYGDVTVRLTPTGTSLLRHSPGNNTLNYTVTAPSGDLDGYGWMVKYNGTTLYSKSVSAFPYGGTDSYFVNTSNLSGMLYVDMYYTKYGNTTWFTNIYTMNNITLGNNTLADIISNFGNTGTGGYGFKKTTLALLGFVAIILIMSFVSQFAVAGAGIIGWMGLAFMWYAGLISASLLWLVGLSVIAVLVIRGGFN